MDPEISIVVATRNRAGKMESPPVGCEIIVVDNASSDKTSEILREWAAGKATCRVLRVYQPERSSSPNSAIAAVNGQIPAFLGDDVVAEPSYLIEVYKYLSQHDCEAAHGAVLPLAARVLQRGGWIGHTSRSQVVREIDPGPLTEECAWCRQRLRSRSDVVLGKPAVVAVLCRFVGALTEYAFYWVLGRRKRQCRAKGRYYRYYKILRLMLHRDRAER